jgi:hypothetical protein
MNSGVSVKGAKDRSIRMYCAPTEIAKSFIRGKKCKKTLSKNKKKSIDLLIGDLLHNINLFINK